MMRPDNLKVIGQILSPLRRSQSKTITLVIQGIAWMAQAASIPVAAFVSQATGSQINSALTRFYRLLHNPKLDDLKVTRQMLSFFAQLPGPFLIAIDWTEWHPPLRMLLASVIRGSRAIPVQAMVFSKTHIHRSQNTWENNFLRLLCWLLNEIKASACFLSDRGFRRVSYLKLLQEQKEHSFLVRIADQITVEFKRGKRLLKNCGLQPGHALDLGTVLLRQDGAVSVRVIGIWAKGQREPWWLATNLEDSLAHLAALYDRRMAIEEQIRDTKGARFGLKLVWTQIKTPQALARFTLFIGLAVLLLTAIGHAMALRRPDLRLTSKTKGHRLSLLTIGHLFFHYFLTTQTPSLKFLQRNIPPPSLRSFPWLQDNTPKKEAQK
jgi:hypothetical protein